MRSSHLLSSAWTAAILVACGFSVAPHAQQKELATVVQERVRCDQERCSRPALLFVHGLGGSVGTWQGKGPSWPALIASDAELDRFDIYRLDYMTHVQGAPTKPTAQNIVDSMIRILAPTAQKYSAIYLICHSLGGNLMRHYLAQLDIQADDTSTLGRYRGLFLLGTPMEGSDLASYKRIANIFAGGSLPALDVLQVIETNPYLELVNTLWNAKMQRDSRLGRSATNVWAAYETVKTRGLVYVVSKASASALVQAAGPGDALDRRVRGFAKDHFGLAKPDSAEDDVYKWVKQELLASESSR